MKKLQVMADQLSETESQQNQQSQRSVHTSLSQRTNGYSSITQQADTSTPSRRKKCQCYRQKGSLLEHTAYFCSLSVAAYVGVVCRIYLSELVNWDGVPLFPSLYAQLVGTVIMGVVTSHKAVLSKTRPFFYQAIATGLCGSITTFSSWNSEAVTTLLQSDQEPPDNGTRVLGWFTTLLLGLGMSSAALALGRHLAALSPWADSRGRERDVEERSKCCEVVGVVVWVVVWLVMSTLVLVVPYALKRRDLVFSCLLASLGAYLRWHLSPFNSAFQNFRLGTFVANVVGAWVLGGVVSALDLFAEGELLYDMLVGVSAGFCGCLTTVSTFAVELSDLPLWASYVYGLSSIALAQVGLILVRGTVQWTGTISALQ